MPALRHKSIVCAGLILSISLSACVMSLDRLPVRPPEDPGPTPLPGTDWPDDPLSLEVPQDSIEFPIGPDPLAPFSLSWDAMPGELASPELPAGSRVHDDPVQPDTPRFREPVNGQPAQRIDLPDPGDALTPTPPPAQNELPPGAATGDAWPLPARLALAWRIFFDESPKQALPHFVVLEEQAPDRADVQLGLGRCLLWQGDIVGATAHFEKALELDSGSIEAAFFAGLVAYQQGYLRDAIGRWERLGPDLERLPAGPLHRDHAWLLARAYLGLGNADAGERWFARALAVGAQQADGSVHPPDPTFEWILEGTLPGEPYVPVGRRSTLELPEALVFAAEGCLWQMRGRSLLRQRLTWPPPGDVDGHPAPEPLGQRLAFLSRARDGGLHLVLQHADGTRQRLLERELLPVTPRWLPDRSALLVVGLAGELQVPRVFLVRISSREVELLSWPEGGAADPAVDSAGGLVLAVASRGHYRLARFRLGEAQGTWLEPLALEGTSPGSPSGPSPSGPSPSGPSSANTAGLASREAGAPPSSASAGEPPPATRRDPDTHGARDTRRPSPARPSREAGRWRPPLPVPDPWTEPDGTGEPDPVPPSPPEEALATGLESGGGAVPARDPDPSQVSAWSSGAVVTPPEARGGSFRGRDPLRRFGGEAGTVPRPVGGPPPPSDVSGRSGLGSPDLLSSGLISSRQPVVSPRSEEGVLAYVQQMGARRRIVWRDERAGLERVLSPTALDCHSPDFSRSGRWLAYVCRREASMHLQLFDRETGRTTVLFEEPLEVGQPAFWWGRP